MARWWAVILGLGAVLALSSCSVAPSDANGAESATPSTSSKPSVIPTVNPTLIPTEAPATTVDVDSAKFDDGFGGFVFKIGDGPTWCSVGADALYVICEQSEVSTQYKNIPVPASCDYSYGYQVRLWAEAPAVGQIAEFVCASGYYADPTDALTLASGEKTTVGPFSCYVDKVTARCENQTANYIVLGPKAWALGL
jgi:hypothetical protein